MCHLILATISSICSVTKPPHTRVSSPMVRQMPPTSSMTIVARPSTSGNGNP